MELFNFNELKILSGYVSFVVRLTGIIEIRRRKMGTRGNLHWKL